MYFEGMDLHRQVPIENNFKWTKILFSNLG